MKKITILLFLMMVLPICTHADYSGAYMTEKYNFSGCDDHYYCPESYYASPVVCDIDYDGTLEIISANYAITVTDARTGAVEWKVNSGSDRSSAYSISGEDTGFANVLKVCDIDGDSRMEIITVHSHGLISVLSSDGYFKYGWPQYIATSYGQPVDRTVTALDICDFYKDGTSEIVVGAGVDDDVAVWLYDCYGNVCSGWPQLDDRQNALINTHDTTETAFGWGVFRNGITVGDINNDKVPEILVATDTGYLDVYNVGGKLMKANNDVFGGRTWGKVAIWESENTETNMQFNEGWGYPPNENTSRAERYKAELGHAAITVDDLDGNGTNEVVVSAIVLDRYNDLMSNGSYGSSRYMTFFVFNGDHTRFQNPALHYDWSESPSDRNCMSAPLFQNASDLSNRIQSVPVVCDVNDDGEKEILLNSYDGKVHCFALKNSTKEYGNFPFTLPHSTASAFEYPSPVVCRDIDSDGKNEIIFCSYTDNPAHNNNSGVKGSVYILNSDGSLLSSTPLPDGYVIYETKTPPYSNGAYNKPTVCDVDGDGVDEIVINTRYSGVCVYDIHLTKQTSYKTASQNFVNGKETEFDSYLIGNSNYFKLRDIAYILNGSSNQFEVTYSESKNAIDLISKRRYTAVGGEMQGSSASAVQASPCDSPIYIDGIQANLRGYNINNNNYFRLRDIAAYFGFEVGWNEANQTIQINAN